MLLMVGVSGVAGYNRGMNGEFMHFPEHSPAPAADFVAIAHNLPEATALLLRPNAVQFCTDGIMGEEKAVSYDQLDAGTPPKPKYLTGRVVNEEFYDSAERTYASRESQALPSFTYPTLTVTNYMTEEKSQRPIDVAELISTEAVEIYASGARRNGGGEYLMVDLGVLARQLAGELGLDADSTMAITPQGVVPFEEALPLTEVLLTNMYSIENRVFAVDMDRRGEAALDALQLGVSDSFEHSPHRVTSLKNTDLEVELLLKPIPEMQHCTEELIALVESKGYSLILEKGEVATGEWGFCFSVSGGAAGVYILSAETDLTIAIYTAYEEAKQRFA